MATWEFNPKIIIIIHIICDVYSATTHMSIHEVTGQWNSWMSDKSVSVHEIVFLF